MTLARHRPNVARRPPRKRRPTSPIESIQSGFALAGARGAFDPGTGATPGAAGDEGALGEVQLADVFAEVGLGGGLNAEGAAAVISKPSPSTSVMAAAAPAKSTEPVRMPRASPV